MKKDANMTPFEDERLNEMFVEQTTELKRQLSPIVDQIVLNKLMFYTLPLTPNNGLTERQEQSQKLMKFHIELIHKLLGYHE